MQPLDLSGLPASSTISGPRASRRSPICFLHSYANPAHEQAVLAEVRELWPEVSVVASHQITREWREYERTNTAVLSAYVQPIAERYLARLNDGLEGQGIQGQPLHHAVELRRRFAGGGRRASRSPWWNPARPPASGARRSSAS